MKIFHETYGCTMNQSDTEFMLGRLRDEGHEIVDEIDNSELVIVNTCAVKRTTLNKVIHRLKELKNKEDLKVIVSGCLPLIDLEKIENIGDFEGILSCKTLDRINQVVDKISSGKKNVKEISGHSQRTKNTRFRKDEVSAPISIAEGCTSNCSYCCVKNARGNLNSFQPEKIVNQVKEEVQSKRKQIYITTQDTSAYGIDFKENYRLPNLLEDIGKIPEKFRVRVGMMNPKNTIKILPELIESFKNDRIYDFLHVPVQSGNNRILNEMNRGYQVEDYKKIVENFRKEIPDIQIVTDIIVGFPGETVKEFQDSCELVKKTSPDKVNLTRFTPMPNTKAKKMDQIDSEEKKRRSKKMTEILNEISKEKNEKYVGKEKEGLVIEKGEKGGYKVRLNNYKLAIVENAKPGEFVNIEIAEAKRTYLVGRRLR